MDRQIIAAATVPNGRWADHHVSVEVVGGKALYRNGWSDPLLCDDADQALRFFHERVSASAAALAQ